MLRRGLLLLLCVLVWPALPAASEPTENGEVYDVCMRPVKRDSLAKLSENGWVNAPSSKAAHLMAQYLALRNASDVKAATEKLEYWEEITAAVILLRETSRAGAREAFLAFSGLADISPIYPTDEDGNVKLDLKGSDIRFRAFEDRGRDTFLLKENDSSLLWLRYRRERLMACTLFASETLRTDILLRGIRGCRGWMPRITRSDNGSPEFERWGCSDPRISDIDHISDKLTPSIIRVPEDEAFENKNLIFEVRL